MTEGGGGVGNSQNLRDVIYECPLMLKSKVVNIEKILQVKCKITFSFFYCEKQTSANRGPDLTFIDEASSTRSSSKPSSS